MTDEQAFSLIHTALWDSFNAHYGQGYDKELLEQFKALDYVARRLKVKQAVLIPKQLQPEGGQMTVKGLESGEPCKFCGAPAQGELCESCQREKDNW
jgi:hypothetical protein